jgi:hypothetical protein
MPNVWFKFCGRVGTMDVTRRGSVLHDDSACFQVDVRKEDCHLRQEVVLHWNISKV